MVSPFLKGKSRGKRARAPRGSLAKSWRPDLSRKEDTYHQLVLHWQEPLYNLARRMLKNDADAADVTQEIFTTLLKNLHRYDLQRRFQPWLYRVATNVIYRFIRESKLRREKEQSVAMKPNRPAASEQLERQELEELIESQLRELPEEFRALLVLHFYNGLSQRDLARVLEIPRTTVASRLQRALSGLKSSLQNCGYLALIPNVEAIMQNTGTLKVPVTLSQQLLSLGTSAVSGSVIALGGILMTKKIILALVAASSSLQTTRWK